MADDAIAIRFIGDVSSLEMNMKRGAKSVGIFSDKAQKGLRDVSGAIAKVTAAAGVVTAAVGAMAVSASNAAAELQAMAQMSNTSVTSFQRLAAGAKSVFIEQDKLADILKDVNDRVGDFITTGGGPMADFFEKIAPKIGVTIDQFRKLSGPEALQFYYNSLEAANVSQQEMTFFLEAMASDATKLIPLLKNNGAQFKKLGDDAEKAGRVMSELEVQKLTDSKKAFDEIGASVKSLGNNITSALNPEINAFKENVVSIVGHLNDLVGKFKEIREEQEKQAKIQAIIGKEHSGRSRGSGTVSKEAKEINELLEKRVELEQQINNKFIQRGGRSSKDFEDQKAQFEERKAQSQEELTQINARIEALRAESEAAQKVFDIKTGVAPQAPKEAASVLPVASTASADPFADYDVQGDPFNDEFYNQQQERIKILLESLDETKAIEEEYRLQKADLEAAFNQGQFESKAAYALQLEELEARHQEKLTDLVQSGVKARDNFEKLSFQNKSKFVLGQMQTLTQGIAQHSRKAFEINKAAGIANAIVNTAQGVTQALSAYPPPISFVMAAAQAAAGFAQIQAIRSASFKGGGAGIAPSQAADPVTKVADVGGGSSGGSSSTQTSTMYVKGVNANSLFTGPQLIDIINEAQANGSKIVFA